MAEENKQDWRVYVIPDLRTWSFPKEDVPQSKIEYYNSFEEAKKRFYELRKAPYNSEKALGNDGQPSARLTLGVERGNAAFDILHVRGGENVLVDDFTRHSELSKDSSLLDIIRKTAAEIGYDKVNSYPLLENGRYGEPSFVPFDKWAAENKQFNLTGGRKMEHNTTFEVSSISKIENGSKVKALANVVINGELAVRGVKVMEGEKGAFVAMPSKKMGYDYADVAFPITKDAREALNNAVMKSYEQLMSSSEKTLKNDIPTAERPVSSVSVQLKAVEKNSLKAAGQITIDGCFVVKDVKVLNGSENKPFVSMPSYQTQTGDYAQYALPITKAFHEKIENAVLGSYHPLGKTEYKGVKYTELGDKNDIAHLPKQNNRFAASLMAELDKAGIKYQARVEDMTSISVHKSDMPRVTDIKNELVKTLNPEKQQNNTTPKHKR